MTVKDVTQFFREVQIELSKVEWPSTAEWLGSTVVVLFVVAVFAVYLGVVDMAFNKLVTYIFGVFSNN
jgi:preprotein translocase SecE subunit